MVNLANGTHFRLKLLVLLDFGAHRLATAILSQPVLDPQRHVACRGFNRVEISRTGIEDFAVGGSTIDGPVRLEIFPRRAIVLTDQSVRRFS